MINLQEEDLFAEPISFDGLLPDILAVHTRIEPRSQQESAAEFPVKCLGQ